MQKISPLDEKRSLLLEEMKVTGKQENVPNISETGALFLQHLIQIKEAKNILEIGTAHGYSSINMGLAAEKLGAKIISIDFSKPSIIKAEENIKKAELGNTISLMFGNALEIIPTLKGTFDFVFIDGMMRQTIDFIKIIWDKTEHNGVIIIDDVIKFKDKMQGLDDFLASNNISSATLPLDPDDGVMLIIKDSSITLL